MEQTEDKGVPPFRRWQLNENSTRYENALAAPSDEQLQKYWSAWAGVALFAGLFTLLVFLSLVTSRKARQQPFNLYLIYLMFPDMTFSLLCGTTCLLNAANGSYWSHWMCNFQQWYSVWGITANFWLNAVITRQLHLLLTYSHQRRRYRIPSPKRVSLQALAVYLYCAFLGTWGLIGTENFPYHALQIGGLACLPVEVDTRSSLFFWLVAVPLFFGIPSVYVAYVAYDIRKRGLLPPEGKRRMLALYFGRIILVFVCLWGPFFVLFAFASWLPVSVMFIGGTVTHLQGPISSAVSMAKPDVLLAVKRFVRCQCCKQIKAPPKNFVSSTSPSEIRSDPEGAGHDPSPADVIPYSSIWPNKDGEYTDHRESMYVLQQQQNREGEDMMENVSRHEEIIDRGKDEDHGSVANDVEMAKDDISTT